MEQWNNFLVKILPSAKMPMSIYEVYPWANTAVSGSLWIKVVSSSYETSDEQYLPQKCTFPLLIELDSLNHSFLCTMKLLFIPTFRNKYWDSFQSMSLWRTIARTQVYMWATFSRTPLKSVERCNHCQGIILLITKQITKMSHMNCLPEVPMSLGTVIFGAVLLLITQEHVSIWRTFGHHHWPVSGLEKRHSWCYLCSRNAKVSFTLGGAVAGEAQRKAECL